MSTKKTIGEAMQESNTRMLALIKSHPQITLSEKEVQDLTITIQKSIFYTCMKKLNLVENQWTTSSEFEAVFGSKYAEVMYNLDPNSSTKLIERILNGTIDPAQIGELTYRDYDPEITQAEYHQYELTKIDSVIVSHQESKIYTCSKCTMPMIAREMSNRSADEQQKLELTCNYCGHRAYI